MFGLTTIRTSSYDSMQKENESLRAEVKGFYEGKNNENAYFKAYEKQFAKNNLAAFLPMEREHIKEAYEQNGPLYGVVHRIAQSTGDVSKYLELYDKVTGDVVESHWVIDLINHPNDRFTRTRYVEAWSTNKLLYADAWIYAPLTKGAERICKEMYIIPSQDVVPSTGGVTQPLKGITVKSDPSRGLIETKDLVISFDYSLDAASFFGTSKAIAAGKYLSVITRGINRADTSIKNGGAANIITPKGSDIGVSPSDADNVEKKVNGIESANKTVAMRTPVEVHTLGGQPNQLGIMEAHKEAITILCFVYGLPVDLVYGQSKYENAKEAKKAIYEMNAIPLAEEFGADLLHHFGLDDQYEFRVNTDAISVLQDDPGDVLDNLTKMNATLNEKREAYGYDPIDEPWADQPMLPMGTMFGNENAVDFNE